MTHLLGVALAFVCVVVALPLVWFVGYALAKVVWDRERK